MREGVVIVGALGLALLVGCGGEKQAPADAEPTTRPEAPAVAPAVPEENIDDTSETVTFTHLDEIEAMIAAGREALAQSNWAAAFAKAEEARLVMKLYRGVVPPEEVADRRGALEEKLGALVGDLQQAAESDPEAVVKLWGSGLLTPRALQDFFGKDGEDAAWKEINRLRNDGASALARRQQINRGVVIYLGSRSEPLVEYHLAAKLRDAAKLGTKPAFVWSNTSGERVGGTPWLNIRIDLRKKTSRYKAGNEEFSYNLSLASGYTAKVKVDAASRMETSWDKVGQQSFEVALPDEMTYSSKDSWFPGYVKARAEQLSAESAAERLLEALGALVVHSELADAVEDPEAPISLALLRARAAHKPAMFEKTLGKVLAEPAASEPATVAAVVASVEFGEGDEGELRLVATAMPQLSAEARAEVAAALWPMKKVVDPRMLLAVIAHLEGQELNRLISSISYKDTMVRETALAFIDGRYPCAPHARGRLAGYVMNFTSREGTARPDFMRAHKHWLTDEDMDFAVEAASDFVDLDAATAGPLILESLSNDVSSAVRLAQMSGWNKCPEELEIAARAVALIGLAPDEKTQTRLVHSAAYKVKKSADLWRALLQACAQPKLTAKNRSTILQNLRKHAAIVGPAEQAALQRLTKQ